MSRFCSNLKFNRLLFIDILLTFYFPSLFLSNSSLFLPSGGFFSFYPLISLSFISSFLPFFFSGNVTRVNLQVFFVIVFSGLIHSSCQFIYVFFFPLSSMASCDLCAYLRQMWHQNIVMMMMMMINMAFYIRHVFISSEFGCFRTFFKFFFYLKMYFFI